MTHGVAEELLEHANGAEAFAAGARLPQRGEPLRAERQSLAYALGVTLAHAPPEIVAGEQRIHDVEVLTRHGPRGRVGAAAQLGAHGFVAVFVHHPPHEIGGEQRTLRVNLRSFTDRTGHLVEILQGHGPVDADRELVPVKVGKEHEKLVQHLQRRGELLMKPVEDVQHERLQRVRADQRVVRAEQPPLVETPRLDQHDGPLEDLALPDERVHLLQKTQRG